MAELKTQENDASVDDYLNSVEDEKKREASFKVKELMEDVTGEEARMWGDSIVGFGHYNYKYASGREGEWMLVGFAPRLQLGARIGECLGLDVERRKPGVKHTPRVDEDTRLVEARGAPRPACLGQEVCGDDVPLQVQDLVLGRQ